MKYEALVESYERYDSGCLVRFTIFADDDKECVRKLAEHTMSCIRVEDFDTLIEEGKTLENILNHLDSNGDGCDYIYYIKNVTEERYLFRTLEEPIKEETI